ncbi:MAG: hypothetical protein EBQ82_05695 [Betaproteobacteria bacterium]|nr:hypothetical protein [Betaproteobacteria bacterium]NBY04878.1 hypothetical protein [Betaproteobacteria bacterium]
MPMPMPTQGACAKARLQVGLSLADWLVGQTLAAMVVLAALGMWGFAQQNHALAQEGMLQSQQMTWVWRTLGQHIRQAGAAQAQQSASGAISLSMPSVAWLGTDGAGALSDGLTTVHWRNVEGRDCQGNTKGSTETIRNRFSINSKSELACLDESNATATTQSLAEGIEDMQLRYAQARVDGQGVYSLQWVTAPMVSDPHQVMAIEVCIRRVGAPVAQALPAVMKGCQGETLAKDGRPRWVHKQVFAWRQVSIATP